MIEVLSPTNKTASGLGISEHLRKRAEVLQSPASLVEIDLLREGKRPPFAGDLSPLDYLILVHRAWERPRVWAKGWRLPEAVPQVPIPLREDDRTVFLDLAHALRLVYDRGGYDLVLDYSAPPTTPLPAADQAWVQGVLAAR